MSRDRAASNQAPTDAGIRSRRFQPLTCRPRVSGKFGSRERTLGTEQIRGQRQALHATFAPLWVAAILRRSELQE